jgi:hypothetical protein
MPRSSGLPGAPERSTAQSPGCPRRGRDEERLNERALAVAGHPKVGDPPALCVHGAEDVVLDQRRQAEVLRREGSGGVVARNGAGVVR